MPSTQVFADGFRNPFQSASAIAQGNAFAAQADDPSAIHYNPAGMTQLRGLQQSVGIQFVSPRTTFTSPTGVTVQNELDGPVGLPPPGQLFLTANLKDLGVRPLENFTVGLGVVSLYGFAAEYPANGPFATSLISASLPLLDIKPTIAYKFNDRLSVGLGADIFTFAGFLGEGHAERKFISPGGGIPPGSQVELNGSGTTAGLNASLLYTLVQSAEGRPLVNLGFVWRSQAVLPLNGELRANGALIADASTSIRFPESYEGGLAWWPVRRRDREWKLEADVNYVRWQSIRNFDVALSTGTTLLNPQRWSNAISVGVGTEYKWLGLPSNPAWEVALRTGYLHSAQAIPNMNFDPAIADGNIHVLSVGAGFICKRSDGVLGIARCGKVQRDPAQVSEVGIDLAYNVSLFEPRTVQGNVNPSVNGRYETIIHAGAINFRVNF